MFQSFPVSILPSLEKTSTISSTIHLSLLLILHLNLCRSGDLCSLRRKERGAFMPVNVSIMGIQIIFLLHSFFGPKITHPRNFRDTGGRLVDYFQTLSPATSHPSLQPGLQFPPYSYRFWCWTKPHQSWVSQAVGPPTHPPLPATALNSQVFAHIHTKPSPFVYSPPEIIGNPFHYSDSLHPTPLWSSAIHGWKRKIIIDWAGNEVAFWSLFGRLLTISPTYRFLWLIATCQPTIGAILCSEGVP